MKKKVKGSRSWSRILAVQAIYLMIFNQDAKEQKVIKDLLNKPIQAEIVKPVEVEPVQVEPVKIKL